MSKLFAELTIVKILKGEILTIEENTGKAVVENLALTRALLLCPFLSSVTLFKCPRVNLIRTGCV